MKRDIKTKKFIDINYEFLIDRFNSWIKRENVKVLCATLDTLPFGVEMTLYVSYFEERDKIKANLIGGMNKCKKLPSNKQKK